MNEIRGNGRRMFLKGAAAAGLSLTVFPALARFQYSEPAIYGDDDIDYTQKSLPYSYNTLEPAIDAMTMEIHYTKHAAGYTKNLADAMAAESADSKHSIGKLLGNIGKYSAKMRNNAGGHYNHELFWRSMRAPVNNNLPAGKLLKAIEKNFNSFDAFKKQFEEAAKNRFGSGWAWLVMKKDEKLVIGSTANQDNPLMNIPGNDDVKGYPILGLDVWEHAYYLKYQNRRPDYITSWWTVVNWDYVSKRLQMAD